AAERDLKLLREVLARIRCCLSQRNGHRPIAATRSSIRSCSTSQNLSDDRRSLSVSSVRADSSSSVVSGRDVPERLLGLRLAFDIRELVCLSRAGPINDSPLRVLSFSANSHHYVESVLQNRSAARGRVLQVNRAALATDEDEDW